MPRKKFKGLVTLPLRNKTEGIKGDIFISSGFLPFGSR